MQSCHANAQPRVARRRTRPSAPLLRLRRAGDLVAVLLVASSNTWAQTSDDPALPPLKPKGERADREKLTADERKVIAAMKKRNVKDLRSRRVPKRAGRVQWKLRRTFQGKGDSRRLKIKLSGNRHYRFRLYAAGLDGAEASAKMYDGSDEVVAATVNVPSTEEIQSAKARANAKAPFGTRASRTTSRRLPSGLGVPFAAKPGPYEIAIEANALWLLVLEQTPSQRRSVRQNRRSPGRYR